MEKPIEPNPEDCCNSGCNPCIFDIYEKQLILYNKNLGNENRYKPVDNGIIQWNYTQFKVIKNVMICDSHYLILFKNLDGKKVFWNPGDHFLYKYIASDKSCTRAYTPVMVKSESEDYDFAIVVKNYVHGIVSPNLCNLTIGDTTSWRGPYGSYKLEPNKYKRIIMIAQGTGIAPFMTIINSILNNEDDMTKVILFYCSKNENTIIFREELYSFKLYWNFKYNIFISNCTKSKFNCLYQEPIVNNKLSIEYLNKLRPFSSSDQFLICGSTQFNEVYDSFLKSIVPQIDNKILF